MTPLYALSALSLLGYHLTFDAEMTSPNDMSQFINTFINGDTELYSNHEAENYAPFNVNSPAQPYTFTNGALVISATPTQAGNQPYTSGMLETGGIFSQSSGYFEIRAYTPAAQGFWPAFWLLPTSYYPEIDILEQPNNSGSDSQYWTHTSTASDNSGGFTDTGINLEQGYHTYGFLWTANQIQYVFDGQLVGWPHDTPPSMAGLGMYMIANLAVGAPGGWVGTPPAGASSVYGIDYIRAFSNDPTVPAVSQEPISSPDGINTMPVLMPPTPVAPLPVGVGRDVLTLQMAEDAYQGDAQFTVSIDGKQHGGTFTTTAYHSLGQTQAFTFKGNFGTAKHTVSVSFLNDLSGSGGDRNLYVLGASVDGATINSSSLTELINQSQSFGFCNAQILPVKIGTGPDTFSLGISEKATSANARYTVSVDGVLQGGQQIAVANHAYGQSQVVTVNGNFGPAAHTVKLNFLNGAKTGATQAGPYLYVDSLSYNTIATQNAATALVNAGSASIATALQQPDTLVLTLAEDAWQGDAQAQISMDGAVIGLVPVTAANAAGNSQLVTLSGNWGGGAIPHTVTVNYLNDMYSGPGQDRNLYLKSLAFDGTTVSGSQQIMRSGPVVFSYNPALAATAPAAQAAAAKAAWKQTAD